MILPHDGNITAVILIFNVNCEPVKSGRIIRESFIISFLRTIGTEQEKPDVKQSNTN